MVGSINDNPLRTLLQSTAQQTPRIDAPRPTAKKAVQAIMEQLTQTSEQGKALMKQSATASSLTTAAADRTLPRGSLVDILV